jgi:multicomponent Na+:H+ antiporter subunit A
MAVSGLFLTHGAPDLALTQLLVETVIVVGFVVGLGRLRRKFPPTAQLWRTARISVSALLGLGVMAALATSAGSPSGDPAVEQLIEEAVADGGGNNVVNVILTDIRALDTFGEIAVLVVVAVGVLALMGRSQVVRNREEEQA